MDHISIIATTGLAASLLLISLNKLAKRSEDSEKRLIAEMRRIEENAQQQVQKVCSEIDNVNSNIFWEMRKIYTLFDKKRNVDDKADKSS